MPYDGRRAAWMAGDPFAISRIESVIVRQQCEKAFRNRQKREWRGSCSSIEALTHLWLAKTALPKSRLDGCGGRVAALPRDGSEERIIEENHRDDEVQNVRLRSESHPSALGVWIRTCGRHAHEASGGGISRTAGGTIALPRCRVWANSTLREWRSLVSLAHILSAALTANAHRLPRSNRLPRWQHFDR